MALIAPRLLTPGQARKYLAGLEPSDFADPIGTRLGLMYDRALLDAKLDALSGLNRTLPRDDPEAELARWLQEDRGDGPA